MLNKNPQANASMAHVMPAQTKTLWAPLVTPTKGKPWIDYEFIRRTRAMSREAFLDRVPFHWRELRLEQTRFVRVIIVEQGGAS